MTHHWGYMSAIFSALIFGIGATLNKIALADIHPTIAAGLVYLFAGLALSIVRLPPLRNYVMSALQTSTKTETKLVKKDIGILVLVILSGATIAPLLFLNGLNQTTAINASLLQNTESLFTVLMAFLFLKERACRKDWTGIIFTICRCFVFDYKW